MIMKIKLGFSPFDGFFVVMIAFVCGVFGYLHLASPGVDNGKAIRGVVILLSFAIVCFFYFIYVGRLRFSTFTKYIVFVVVYAVFVSLTQGRIGDSISYFVRLISFVLLVDLSRRESLRRDSWQHVMQAIFVLVLFVFVLQVIYDQVTSRVIFMNGSYRHSGSFGSPIGFATALAVVSLGFLSFWLKTKNRCFFLCSMVATFLVFLTATRSISLMLVLASFFAVFVNSKFSKKTLILLLLPFFVFAVIRLMPDDIGFVERILILLEGRELDSSTMFRFLVVDTYFSNVSLRELIFGFGLGSFPLWFYQKTGIVDVAPHFEWLWLLSEFGLVVFVAYYLCVLYMLYSVTRLALKKRSPFLLFLGFVALGAHQLVFQFSNPLYFYQAYIPFALLFGWFLASFDLHRLGADVLSKEYRYFSMRKSS